MHDIDRVRLESQSEAEMLEAVPFEAEQFEFPQSETSSGETGEVFGETEQMELASELLEVTNEAELDRFLGDLINRAGQAVGKFIKSPEGQAIGSALKGAAKQVLPAIGSAVGGYLGGPTGAQLGEDAASAAEPRIWARARRAERRGRRSSRPRDVSSTSPARPSRTWRRRLRERTREAPPVRRRPRPRGPTRPDCCRQPRGRWGLSRQSRPRGGAAAAGSVAPTRSFCTEFERPCQPAPTRIGCSTRKRARCWRGSLG